MKNRIMQAGKTAVATIVAIWFGLTVANVATAGQAFAAIGYSANMPVINSSFVEGSLAVGANDSTGQMLWSVSGNWAQPFPATVSIKQITTNGEVDVDPRRLTGGFNLTNTIVLPQVGGSVVLPPATPASRPSFDITVIDPQPDETFIVRVQTLSENEVLYWSSGADTANAIQNTVLNNPVP